MTTIFGRCVYKGNCELNCQVFVSDDSGNSASSICLACKHLAAFHIQDNSIAVGSSSHPPSVEKLSANEGTPCTAVNEAKRFGQSKSIAEWKADKRLSAFRKTSKGSKKSRESEFVIINIGLMLFDEKVVRLKTKWGKKLPIQR